MFSRHMTTILVISCAMSCATDAIAQQTTITFQPGTLPGGGRNETEWHEQGFTFLGNPSFTSQSNEAAVDSGARPVNGTDHIAILLDDVGATFFHDDGAQFNLLQIDLAEYSTVTVDGQYQPEFIVIDGLLHDGGIVTTSFQLDLYLDGLGGQEDFQTFSFGPEFSNLVEVRFQSDLFSMDNLVVQIPAPAPATVLMCASLVGLRRRR